MALFLYGNDLDNFFEDPFSVVRSVGNRRNWRSGDNGRDTSSESNAVGFRPRIDVHQDKEKNIVTATFELPGLKKEDISIDVHDDHLIVSGENNTSLERSEGGYTVRERRSGKFSRSLKLPVGTKAEHVNAKMEHGILTISFPANQPENAPQRITVN